MSGAIASTTFEKGVAVFMNPQRGAMINASLTGQRIRSLPMSKTRLGSA